MIAIYSGDRLRRLTVSERGSKEGVGGGYAKVVDFIWGVEIFWQRLRDIF